VDLAAQLEIHNLTASFTGAVNRGASADLARLFTADGAWYVPGLAPVVGHAAIAAQLDGLLGRFTRLIQLTHSGTVEVGGDRASAVWYISERAQDEAGTTYEFTGVYSDDLTRTEAGWRFRERRFDFLYRSKSNAPGKWYPHPRHRGGGPSMNS
jgi:ketosteroid isomerase-like protein